MKIHNRKASFDYHLFDRFEAGVVLTGAEVKSLKEGRASLDEAYVRFIGGEAYLVNAHIHPYRFADIKNFEPTRTRKLLLHKRELLEMTNKAKQKGLTIVPLAWYTRGHKIKLEVALAKGKKRFEKRASLKKKDLERDLAESLRVKE